MLRMIWAQGLGREIGKAGAIPWHLPEDLAHFRAATAVATVIMGRRTWESLPNAPLRGRKNIMVTRATALAGATTAPSLDDAIRIASTDAVTIGGERLYRDAMPHADELIVTQVQIRAPNADTFAPRIGPEWACVASSIPQQSTSGYRYQIQRWRRLERADQGRA